MIGCDLRLCGGQHGQDGGLAHGGQADEPYVGDGFQLQLDLAILGFLAVLCKAGALTRRRGKAGVALAAAAAPEHGAALARFVHVGDDRTGRKVAHDRTDRHAHDERFAVLAALHFGLAAAAVLRAEMPLELELKQRGQARIRFKDEVAAASAVAAGGAPAGNVLLAVKGCTAVTAVAGLDDDACFINKLHFGKPFSSFPFRRKEAEENQIGGCAILTLPRGRGCIMEHGPSSLLRRTRGRLRGEAQRRERANAGESCVVIGRNAAARYAFIRSQSPSPRSVFCFFSSRKENVPPSL